MPDARDLIEEARLHHFRSQERLGDAVEVSRRTVQRWQSGESTPTSNELHRLARAVHPMGPNLARRIAVAGGTTPEALGLVAPALPTGPAAVPAVPPPPDALVDSVVCAAANVLGVPPASLHPALHAAFARARVLNLDAATVAQVLAPAKKR